MHYLDTIGVEDRLVRRAYDIVVASLKVAPAMMEDENFPKNKVYLNKLYDRLRGLLNQLGFLDFDPYGVNRIGSKLWSNNTNHLIVQHYFSVGLA